MKNMTIGKRIGLGFSGLLAICIALGCLAIVKMRSASQNSHDLSDKYVPEVMICEHLGAATHNTMLAIRSFGFTSDPKYYDQAQQSMAEIKDQIQKAQELVNKYPSLVKLKEEIEIFEKTNNEFVSLVTQTKATSELLEKAQSSMNSSAGKFVPLIEAFQNRQEQAMRADIKAAVTADKLEERTLKLELAAEIRTLMNQVRIAAWKSQAERDFKFLEPAAGKFAEMRTAFSQIQPITHKEEDKAALTEMRAATKAYEDSITELTAAWMKLEAVRVERAKISSALAEAARSIVDVGLSRVTNLSSESSTHLDAGVTTLVIGLGICIVVGVVLAFGITLNINRTIGNIAKSLSAGAEQTSAAASQVAAASQSLAECGSEQAAALEETSASIEEMTSMGRRNADAANKTKSIANEAHTAAQTGTTDMAEMSLAMNEIKSSSAGIAKIIKSIDEIAFQTNLLALNAAVEAARAGEAGMGFAVVADEVRSLAQRSAQSAKETTEKIEAAITKSDRGVQISSKVAANFDQITQKIREVDQYVAEISAGANEHALGVSQISSAITQMDSVTQTNAASAEESAAAAEELNAQADSMRDAVEELSRMVGVSSNSRPAKSPTGVASKNSSKASFLAPKRSPKKLGDSSKGAGSSTSSADANIDIPMPAPIASSQFQDF